MYYKVHYPLLPSKTFYQNTPRLPGKIYNFLLPLTTINISEKCNEGNNETLHTQYN